MKTIREKGKVEIMKFTIKEFREYLDNLDEDNAYRAELEELYAGIVSSKSPNAKDSLIEELEVDWTPQHQRILEQLENIALTQKLQMHSKLKLRLRRWIDNTVKRGCKCVMSQERGCPCDYPADQGCPLLHRI